MLGGESDLTMSYSNRNRRPAPKRSSVQANPATLVLLILVFLAALAAILRPWQHPSHPFELWSNHYKFVNLGLDLQGGLEVVLQVNKPHPNPDDVQRVKTILQNRVNGLGVAEPIIQTQGTTRVLVELPGLSSKEQSRALKLIGEQAVLQFRIVKSSVGNLPLSQYTLSDLGPPLATGSIIANAQSSTNQTGGWVVDFQTTGPGSHVLSKLTRDNIGRLMAVVLDGKIESVATIQSTIVNNGQITGNFTPQQAANLALVLRSGSLPVPIKTVEVQAIGPSLGADAIHSGAIAAGIGLLLVFVLAFIYYGLYFGLVITLGLIFTSILILGVLGGLNATLTLPGIAGLILTIGAAIDGNVISFERIKEELRRNKGIKGSIKAGFGHSLATILDVNLSHLLAAFALFNFSTGSIRGFAVTLAVGVIAAVFSNLVFSKWLMEWLAKRRNFSAPMWFGVPKIDFIRVSPIITSTSVSLAILGALVIGLHGFNYAVDFTSGTAITMKADPSVTVGQVRKLMSQAQLPGVDAAGALIQSTQTPGISGKQFLVQVKQLNQSQSTALDHLITSLPGGSIQQTSTVGPQVGQTLRTHTIYAVLLALGLILIYVWFRFDIVFGVGSVIAVMHDVGIVLGLYALLGREFSLTTVAAVLTLIGYSLNDSIIVSDRMRENLRLMHGQPFKDIVNTSINQTLSRTVMTSLATLLPLLSLLFFGGSVLRDFSFVLVVGIVVGTYSSIYIVAPMVVVYENWLQRRRKMVRAKA